MTELNIVFALDLYLRRTYTWIYNQLRFLKDIHVLILSETLDPDRARFTLNTHELFSFPGLVIAEKPNFSMRVLRGFLRLILVNTGLDLLIFAWKAKKRSCSLIHAHFGYMGWKFIPVAKMLGVPLIVSFYGYDYDYLPNTRPKWQKRYQKLFKCSSLFVAEGEYGRKKLIEKGVSPKLVKVHHLGVYVDAIPFKIRNLKQGEVLRLVQVASLSKEKKGHRTLVNAMKLLKDKGVIGNVSLTFIGDGALKQEMIDLTERWKLEKYITFVDHISYGSLHQELLKYHIFVQPSLTTQDGDCEGGAPVVLLDAQATGMPVISTYHCDIPEEVIHGKTGILVPEDDYIGLADAIIKFLAEPKLLAEYGTSGRKHVEENYSARKQAEKLSFLYSSIASGLEPK
jgi:colanic acid/amylovoran biosynthesis glycosyltransferase